MPEFDDFTEAFAEFLESGKVNKLADYCDPGVNTDRLNIYRNGYFRSAIDTLVSNYPSVHALLGSETFRQLAKQYVVLHPPEAGTLVGYGSEFPIFLQGVDVNRQLPYLSDIASLDRAWLQVYFSADSEPLSAGDVSELFSEFGNAGLQKIRLVPSVKLVSLCYPITALWQLLKDSGRLGSVMEMKPTAEYTLIWRRGSFVLVRVLPTTEITFFSHLMTGLNFEKAAIACSEESDGFDMSLFFSELITAELLSIQTRPDIGIKCE